ncbi:hypothetical protein RRG08_063486, partial [Elysia crispata]
TDASGKFVVVDVGSCGGNSDGGVFSRSSLGKKLMSGKLSIPQRGYIPGEHRVTRTTKTGKRNTTNDVIKVCVLPEHATRLGLNTWLTNLLSIPIARKQAQPPLDNGHPDVEPADRHTDRPIMSHTELRNFLRPDLGACGR